MTLEEATLARSALQTLGGPMNEHALAALGGDTVRGAELLRNAARQFNKPKGADVGTDRYVIIGVALQTVSVDFVTRFPGGTVHAHGEGKRGKPEVPIVGGTGLFAGATGSIEGQHLANGEKLNMQIP